MALAPLADPSTFIIPACNTALEHGAMTELPEHYIKLQNIFKNKYIFISCLSRNYLCWKS